MRPVNLRLFLCPTILCLLTVALAADTVTVENGDRLNGRIAKVEKGKLYLKTDYAGTVAIAWSKVVSVDSEGRYQVEAETGTGLPDFVKDEFEAFPSLGPLTVLPCTTTRPYSPLYMLV